MKEIIPDLVRLADHLDKKGFDKEASFADAIIKRVHAYVNKKAEGEQDEEKPDDKEMMSPMKDEDPAEEDKKPDAQEACCMKADANLKVIKLRQRARQRRLMLKNG